MVCYIFQGDEVVSSSCWQKGSQCGTGCCKPIWQQWASVL